MSFLPEVEKPELPPGESFVGGWVAYHVQKKVPCAGYLFLTNRRLLFQPMKMGFAMKALMVVGATIVPEGTEWKASLDEVGDVSTDPPASFQGQKGGYLRLQPAAGDAQEIFVVGEHEAIADKIRAAITDAG